MIVLTIIVATLSISGITYSPTRLLLDAHTRTITAGGKKLPPAMWDRFPVLQNYYKGMFTLVEEGSNVPEYPPGMAVAHEAADKVKRPDAVKGGGKRAKSRSWNPYPEYKSDGYRKVWEGEYKECSFDEDMVGNWTKRRGRPDMRVFDGTPEGMPGPVFGTHGLLGINEDICFDRYGRLGSYGYGYSDSEGGLGEVVNDGGDDDEKDIETGWGLGSMPLKRIDWRGVDWGRLQRQCVDLNKDRFDTLMETEDTIFPSNELLSAREDIISPPRRKRRGMPGGIYHISKKKHPRTAVLLRTWTGYNYTPNDIASLRSLISELSILSGGEYSVHLLVHVKDSRVPIWSDKSIYRKTLQDNVPQEFWGIAELWNEAMMSTIYHKLENWDFRELPLHGVYRSTFMPVQWFAHRHPEFEFFWNWEMDVRYTGHYYHLFEKLVEWAKKQPRKHLWERNERFYIPEIHGTWEAFSKIVDATTSISESVWGPVPVEGVRILEDDPVPPFPKPEEDVGSTWGVGEEADLITLNPIFNPEGTSWVLSSDTTGYGYYTEASARYTTNPPKSPKNPTPTDPPLPSPPTPPARSANTGPTRRTAIITASRLSRRLLTRMHWENAIEGHTMFSEMWPTSCALHHGLKAVFVPHPTYIDRKWPAKYLERTFNNGVNGSAGGRQQSVFGDREHNFKGSTWYYNAGFPGGLWRRWLGSEAEGDGGEAYDRRLGRMCLKGMLLHPVKGGDGETGR